MTSQAQPLRPGQLTIGWRWVVGVSWAAIVACIVIVAGAAEVINRSVWWIGQRGDRAPFVLAAVPFVVPIVAVVAVVRSWRSAVAWSYAASVSTLLVALGDRNGSPSAAIVTAALGVAGLCVSTAALSGRIRLR
jgi:hypothetical protein